MPTGQTIHDVALLMAQECFNDTGVRVTTLEFVWRRSEEFGQVPQYTIAGVSVTSATGESHG